MADLIMTIPFSIEANIGREYNCIMKSCSCNWVGFADHDIFLANPHWYKMFVDAISVLGDKAGFIGCVTNRIGSQLQKVVAEKNNDIKYHKTLAERIYKENGNAVQDVTDSQFCPSALMFVTPKKAWYETGGFRENGLVGVDTDYVNKLKAKGYKIYLLKGLYVYHWYRGVL